MANWKWKEEDRLRTRMNALASTFAKTDRILTGRRDVDVKMTSTRNTHVSAPGFSDGRTIYINTDLFDKLGSMTTLVRLLGLNYHELCHIIFTPRVGTVLREQLKAENLGLVFNILEDQRIESQFVALYGPSAKYFTEMVVKFFVENEKTWDMAHLYVHGRRFLPREVREEFSKRFCGTDVQKREAEKLIMEFRRLDLASASSSYIDDPINAQVIGICRKFRKILRAAANMSESGAPNPMHSIDESGRGGCADQHNGSPSESISQQAKERSDEEDERQDEEEANGEDGSGFWDDIEDDDDEEEDDDDLDENKNGGDEDASASESEDEDDDDEESSSSGEDHEDDEDDDASNGTDERSNNLDDEEDYDSDSPGDESGEGSTTDSSDDDGDVEQGSDAHGNGGEPLDDGEFRSTLENILDAVESSAVVKNDIRQIEQAINDPDAFDLDEELQSAWKRNPEPHIVSAAIATEREFTRLHAELQPGWKYGSDIGRLNVQRAISSDDYDDIFDEWDEGREQEAGLEVVIALDVSGSMSGQNIVDACNALWVIKRACDQIDATVSVNSFGAQTRVLFRRGDKVDRGLVPYFDANEPDTCPGQSFRNARRILSQTKRPNRLFVIITDGRWSPYNREKPGSASEDLDELIRTIPGTKMLFGIGLASSNPYADRFDVVQDVKNASQIAPLMKVAISSMLKNAARR